MRARICDLTSTLISVVPVCRAPCGTAAVSRLRSAVRLCALCLWLSCGLRSCAACAFPGSRLRCRLRSHWRSGLWCLALGARAARRGGVERGQRRGEGRRRAYTGRRGDDRIRRHPAPAHVGGIEVRLWALLKHTRVRETRRADRSGGRAEQAAPPPAPPRRAKAPDRISHQTHQRQMAERSAQEELKP